MKPALLALSLALAALACTAERDTCDVERRALDYDEPGPWGPTPREVMQHVEGRRSGTLTWLGGGSHGRLQPSEGQTAVTVVTTLDTDDVVGVQLEHVGEGSLVCIDAIEVAGTLEITTADGALHESLDILVSSAPDAIQTSVAGLTSLTGHDFRGWLTWEPTDTWDGLFLRTSWIPDASGTMRGWLVWGDAARVEIDGPELVGPGVERVLARFEATLE